MIFPYSFFFLKGEILLKSTGIKLDTVDMAKLETRLMGQ